MKIFSKSVQSNLPQILGILFLLASTSTFAETPAEKGLKIIEEAINRDNGYGDSELELKMVLLNAEGQESQRNVKIRQLEVAGDGDKLLTSFDSPSDVQGTALLTYSHVDRNDDQWLFLPATQRVKRISSSNKSGSFMGSEFAYEDLASEELQKFTSYLYLRDEACGKSTCFVVERVPTDKESGYSRQIVWIDKDHYRFMQIQYYDRKNVLLKTRVYSDYQLYLDKFWRSLEIEMKNHQSGKSTKLFIRNIKFQVGLNDSDFDQAALRRVR